jgi:hypothetical protein
MPDDFWSESQAENAARQREWEARARPEGESLPVSGFITHPISRRVERLPSGGERTVVTLGQVSYVEGPDAPRPPASPPPEDAA